MSINRQVPLLRPGRDQVVVEATDLVLGAELLADVVSAAVTQNRQHLCHRLVCSPLDVLISVTRDTTLWGQTAQAGVVVCLVIDANPVWL